MRPRSIAFRKSLNMAVNIVSCGAALLGLFFLVWILYEVIIRGVEVFNIALVTELPRPVGEKGGGFANAILGTLIMTGMAAGIAVPIGILTGIFLAEFGKGTAIAATVQFALTILLGTPSIIIGVFAYTFLVVPFGIKGYAGAFALFVIMVPVVARTTDDMLTMVPNSLRESALALGMPRWRVTFSVVFRAAKSGLITGVLLAIARVSGETAPLLFTAGDSAYWPSDLTKFTANLTVKIFTYSTSPYDYNIKLAWAASLLIVIGVLSVNILSRLMFRERKQR